MKTMDRGNIPGSGDKVRVCGCGGCYYSVCSNQDKGALNLALLAYAN